MNKSRRNALSKIIRELNVIQNKNGLDGLIDELDTLKEEEQDYYNNIPENLQNSQRAQDSEQAIDNLEEAVDLLNEVYNSDETEIDSNLIQEIINMIEEASF
jgi:predicted RNase H-like HicB family nuclease